MLKVDEIGLLKADLARGINLFTGAGFSTLASNALNDSIPVGEDLRKSLVKKFSLEPYSSLDLASLYAITLADRRSELREYLEEVFTISHYNHKYDYLRKLNVEYFYTTNIDDLPFHIFNARSGESAKVLHDVTMYGAPRLPSEVVQFVPLHGNIRHQDADFLFYSRPNFVSIRVRPGDVVCLPAPTSVTPHFIPWLWNARCGRPPSDA